MRRLVITEACRGTGLVGLDLNGISYLPRASKTRKDFLAIKERNKTSSGPTPIKRRPKKAVAPMVAISRVIFGKVLESCTFMQKMEMWV